MYIKYTPPSPLLCSVGSHPWRSKLKETSKASDLIGREQKFGSKQFTLRSHSKVWNMEWEMCESIVIV